MQQQSHPAEEHSGMSLAALSQAILQPPPPLPPPEPSLPPPHPPPPPPTSTAPTIDPPSRLAPAVTIAPSQSASSGTTPIPRSVFSSARLPRTSSLLPPGLPSPTAPRVPSPVPEANAAYGQHFQTHRDSVYPPVSLKTSAAASVQADQSSPREGSRARNRWSTSTISSTSSRTSPYASQHPSASHTRRASVEAVAFYSSQPSAAQPPNSNSHQDHILASPKRSANPAAESTGAYMATTETIASPSRHNNRATKRTTSPPPRKASSTMPYDQSRDRYLPQGHSRERSGKGSRDLGKSKAQKPLSQKAMLSRALQKANTAVQLDNAQNVEGAREAYAEACDLLQQVLQRTSGDDDKRKLEAIRQTYTSRIDELDQLGPFDDVPAKALPARPDSEDFGGNAYIRNAVDEDAPPTIETARVISIIGGEYGTSPAAYPGPDIPQQQHWLQSTAKAAAFQRPHDPMQTSLSRASPRLQTSDVRYAPPPLTTRSPSPTKANMALESTQETTSQPTESSQNTWLDPINESVDSVASSSSSIHSRTSSQGYRRRHIRAASGNTEAEFDTALDAAIEAAYNDGYEPMEPDDYESVDASDEAVMNVLRKVEIARERVRLTEQEAYNDVEVLRKGQTPHQQEEESHAARGGFLDDDSSEEEELLLEEITRDFTIEDFTMERQDGVTARDQDEWNNAPDTKTTPGIRSFSALSEKSPIPPIPKPIQPAAPAAPPPTKLLPEVPLPTTTTIATSPASESVQNRRISGINNKQLKIETTNLMPAAKTNHIEGPIQMRSASAMAIRKDHDAVGEELTRTISGPQRKLTAASEGTTPDPHVFGSPNAKSRLGEAEHGPSGAPSSPSIYKLRKTFSSSSLRSMKSRNFSVSNLDDTSDMSPGTPMGNPFGKAPAVPALPTPLSATLKENMEGHSGGGLHLFEDNFHLPETPGVPNPISMDGPVALEPCPSDFLLRPFWLMRCLYQTLVHPRGGYISTKLFVPRDVWRVKGVKLKNVEDKIANCDYLTAALLKLAKVDTLDADAVLEEMQALETVLEQIQTALSRKLGNEVGVQGSGLMFKDASLAMDDGGSSVPRSTSVSGKASAFSWRRLRPKASGVGLGGSYTARIATPEVKEATTLPTLPMTTHPTNRPAKRDVTHVQFLGPNANYMGSLARLFDAAQAIDQIARQVDDPGLRHADKTQVGLELCTRHAAEFFGFYICRFVLADLSTLLDKFIKRGSEWVMV